MSVRSQASPAGRPDRRQGVAGAWLVVAALLFSGPALGQDGAGCGSATAQTRASPIPATPLTVAFYGVSTLMFDDGRDRILVDGFFSRPRSPVSVSTDDQIVGDALGAGGAPLRAVLTAHAHHDHAMDTAVVAREAPGAVVVGTPSVVTLMRRQRLPDARLCAPLDMGVLVFGAFKITAFYVEHGPALPFMGWILDRPMRRSGGRPVWIGGFTDDKNLSFLIEHGDRRILVHPSAGRRDLTGGHADIVFLGVGRLSAMSGEDVPTYLAGTIGTEARLVVPIHWDRFTTPMGAPLERTPKPLDDVGESFHLLCGFAPQRPAATFLLMDAGARLRLDPSAGFAVEAGSTPPLCPPSRDD